MSDLMITLKPNLTSYEYMAVHSKSVVMVVLHDFMEQLQEISPNSRAFE